MDKQSREIRAVLAEPGSAVMEGRLAGLDEPTLRVDDLHAHYDIGGTTIARRAHEQRPVG